MPPLFARWPARAAPRYGTANRSPRGGPERVLGGRHNAAESQPPTRPRARAWGARYGTAKRGPERVLGGRHNATQNAAPDAAPGNSGLAQAPSSRGGSFPRPVWKIPPVLTCPKKLGARAPSFSLGSFPFLISVPGRWTLTTSLRARRPNNPTLMGRTVRRLFYIPAIFWIPDSFFRGVFRKMSGAQRRRKIEKYPKMGGRWAPKNRKNAFCLLVRAP